jgi:hypothetical protein
MSYGYVEIRVNRMFLENFLLLRMALKIYCNLYN